MYIYINTNTYTYIYIYPQMYPIIHPFFPCELQRPPTSPKCSGQRVPPGSGLGAPAGNLRCGSRNRDSIPNLSNQYTYIYIYLYI